ncbi:MAG: DNA polymerase III subunit beta [Bowdeniella nasicola]|nr:DNA polymerase III subunit beta [Bowdeniella nasicola]
MKFSVQRDVLTEAVTWAARSLPQRPAVPVLAGVRIKANGDTLILSSFDYEVSAKCEIPAEVESPGEVLVLGRLLADICKSLPKKPVDVQLGEQKVVLTCGASRFELPTMPLEDYPTLPEMPPLGGQIAADVFSEAVSQVTIAAARDETLPLLTGVLMEISGEKVTLLATDRYRLAMRELTWIPTNPEAETSLLVRARTLSDVAKSMTDGADVQLLIDDDEDMTIVGFEAGGKHTTSQLVEGDYPKVRRLFPDATPTHAVVETAALIEATKRMALVAERNAPIRLTFTDGELSLDAGQGENAQASEAMVAELVGEEIVTAYNPDYLREGLSAFSTDYVRFSFTHPAKPAVLTGQKAAEGDDDPSFRYLLMPIRVAQ